MRRRGVIAVTLAWSLALGATAFLRYRGDVDAYRLMHSRISDAGVPDFVRNLDYVLIALLAVGCASLVASALTRASPAGCLLTLPPRRGWWKMVLGASVPMALGGLVLMLEQGGSLPGWHDLFTGVVRAPIIEELVFRSVLVAIPLAALGDRPRVFWVFAIAAGLVFGITHVSWTPGGFASGWTTILVTWAGGVWFAWLMRAWRSVLVPILLHGAMNLGWALAGAGNAAGGGLVENILRAATITVATWWTIRSARRTRSAPRD